jgi:hypothetical protein
LLRSDSFDLRLEGTIQIAVYLPIVISMMLVHC